jgi:hypothetical protein
LRVLAVGLPSRRLAVRLLPLRRVTVRWLTVRRRRRWPTVRRLPLRGPALRWLAIRRLALRWLTLRRTRGLALRRTRAARPVSWLALRLAVRLRAAAGPGLTTLRRIAGAPGLVRRVVVAHEGHPRCDADDGTGSKLDHGRGILHVLVM